ncbi:hypothetical protein ASF96_04985 [Microbacterium sp. Leaf179]|nr:hypothetical protein ASF96_04985 [Microbacterium sp. Leaf179]
MAGAATVDESSSHQLTSDQVQFMTDKFVDFGASPAQADSLVRDFQAGIAWDSDGASDPVTVEERVVDGFPYTVQSFEDGSFVASGIAAAPVEGQLSAMSVTECATSGTSAGVAYGTNCLVKEETGAASAQFRASYSVWANDQSIYDVRDAWVNYDLAGGVSGGTFSESTAPGSTWVQYSWQADNPYATTSRYLKLLATSSGVSTYANY